jgi:molecular chaperone GrpE
VIDVAEKDQKEPKTGAEAPEKGAEDAKRPAEAPSMQQNETECDIPGAPEADELASLRAQARERAEFLDMLQRTRAEFSNYRKRIERERPMLAEQGVSRFVLKLLPVLDDFDRALAHAEEYPDFESFVQGIRLIESKIYEVLRSSDIEPFEPLGEPFDPAQHDALMMEPTAEYPDNTVSGVVLKGYRLGDRVLRPARVRVAQAPETQHQAAEDVTDDTDETGDKES